MESVKNNGTVIKARLHNLYSKRYSTIRQIGTQNQLEDVLHKLDNSIEESSQKTRTKLEKLHSFQIRSRYLYDNVRAKHTPTADEEVDKELNILTSRRTILFSQHLECPQCLKSIRREHLNEHLQICKYNSTQDNDIEQFNDASIAVKPHPLRNLKIVSTSFDSIRLSWDLPIFQGGEPITDFEVSYCHAPTKHIKSKETKSKMKIVHKKLSCLRFCNKTPCMDQSFIIEGLSAAQLYLSVRIRCKNVAGWSDYSEGIESVKTRDPIKPLPPQRFHITATTSTSISFSWAPPFHSGGGKVDEYELIFEEETILYNQEAGKKNRKIEMVEKSFKIPMEKTTLTLSDLSGNTLIQNIRLRAINCFGLIGEFTTCQDARTFDSNRDTKIIEEIRRVKASTETVIDSDFFQPGVLQREDKVTYLAKLEKMLRNETMEDEEPRDTSGGLKENTTTPSNPLESRQAHFESKIFSLQAEIEEIEQKLADIKQNTILSVRRMRKSQDEINLLRIEQNSLTNSFGEYFSSGVLSCSVQSSTKDDLQKEIQRVIEEKMTLIAGLKLKTFEEIEMQEILIPLKSKKEEQRKERIAAFHIFKTKLNSTSSLQTQVSGHINLVDICMKAWIDITRYNNTIRKALNLIANIRRRIRLMYAIKKWRFIVNRNNDSALKQKSSNAVDGKGSLLLLKVQVEREQACNEVKSSIVDFTVKADAFGNQLELHMMRLFPKDFIVELKRGDYCRSLREYDDAIKVYRSALEGLSNSTTGTINLQDHMYCIVQERLANTFICECKWNSAIVSLDDLYSRARYIQDNSIMQQATLLLGKCYFNISDVESAVRNYLSTIERATFSGQCKSVLSEAYLGLSRCYDFLHDSHRSLHYLDLYNATTLTLQDSMQELAIKAEDLESQLTNNTFMEGKVVHFERVSANYMSVKNKIEDLRMKEETFQSDSIECQKDIQGLHQLIKRIEDEIDVVSSRNGDMQTSSLVHDNSQQIERTELLKRLEQRKKGSCGMLLEKRKLEEDLHLKQKNAKEERLVLEIDLKLEKNHLMQKILSNRLVRCARFNTMNQNGIDAFGEKSGGRHMIASTIDSDVFVHDIRTGKIKHSFSAKEREEGKSHSVTKSSSIISCIHYYHDSIYFGRMDGLIRSWDMIEDAIKLIAVGHRGMVTSICVDQSSMISGSIDKSLILWNLTSGQMLFRGMGHSRGISCVFCASSYYLSGDLDGELILWKKNEFENKLDRIYRLQASHSKKISVVKCSKFEIICGDEYGYVKSWWLETGSVLHEKKVHDRTISDLQFDATIMVTCSADTTLKVLDVTTFQVLQTIRGHQNPVLSICFDNSIILSLSNDGIMRQWYWNAKEVNGNGEDLLHTFTEGESLKSICDKYGVTVKDLMKWNVNRDLRKIAFGQKLVVVKGLIRNHDVVLVSDGGSNRQSDSQPGFGGDHNTNIEQNEHSPGAKHDLTSLASRLNR